MKKGSRVKIAAERIGGMTMHYSGELGTVISPNVRTNNGQCYWVKLDNGEKRSFLEGYLIPVSDYITLDQVIQAKRAVDKAQRGWVELLSAYQLQEASKK